MSKTGRRKTTRVFITTLYAPGKHTKNKGANNPGTGRGNASINKNNRTKSHSGMMWLPGPIGLISYPSVLRGTRCEASPIENRLHCSVSFTTYLVLGSGSGSKGSGLLWCAGTVSPDRSQALPYYLVAQIIFQGSILNLLDPAHLSWTSKFFIIRKHSTWQFGRTN